MSIWKNPHHGERERAAWREKQLPICGSRERETHRCVDFCGFGFFGSVGFCGEREEAVGIHAGFEENGQIAILTSGTHQVS